MKSNDHVWRIRGTDEFVYEVRPPSRLPVLIRVNFGSPKIDITGVIAMAVKPIPDTSPRVIPMLVCREPEAEIEFCERVLNAEVGVRRPGPDGKTIHAALALGEARIIVQAEFPQLASRAPQTDGSSPVVIFVYVEDVDRAVAMAVAAGGSVLMAAQNHFWGDRSARVLDPSGHVWTIASRIEETSEEQRKERWEDIRAGKGRQ